MVFLYEAPFVSKFNSVSFIDILEILWLLPEIEDVDHAAENIPKGIQKIEHIVYSAGAAAYA